MAKKQLTKKQKEALVKKVSDVGLELVEGKSFLKSKTLYINLFAIAAILLQLYFGLNFSPELQILALGIVNLILRRITKAPLR
jgi:hypothetical protein